MTAITTADIRDAVRGLSSSRATTILAFVILSLAISAGTITFSVVDTVALRPLPYGSPDRLVAIARPGLAGRASSISPAEFFSLLHGTGAFQSLAASRPRGSLTLTTNGTTEILRTVSVTPDLFDTLEVQPVVGRGFSHEHGRTGGPAVAILSYDYWTERHNADHAIVGRTLRFDDQPREILGVLPRRVWYPINTAAPADVYVPYVATATDRDNARVMTMSVVGRLRSGISIEQARADVVRVATSPMLVLSLHDHVVGSAKPWLLLLFAAVGLIVLLACFNIANLFLVRATVRAREFAVRQALGASRKRLAGVVALEGLVLSVSAGAAAIAVSFWGVDVAVANLPPGLLTRVPSIQVDARVLAVSIAASVVCGLVFATAPAWFTARSSLSSLMAASGGPVVGGRRVDRLLRSFLVLQVAVVCVLGVLTTLVIRSYVHVTTLDLGFDRQNIISIGYTKSLDEVPKAQRAASAATLHAELVERTRSVPGVTGVAISANGSLPLSRGSVRYGLNIPGVGQTLREDMLETRIVTPEYFDVMAMQLLRGRGLLPTDRTGSPGVLVINDIAASRFFPNRDPVGTTVGFKGRQATIVGITRGVRFHGPETDIPPEMYVPLAQEPYRDFGLHGVLVVRTAQNPSAVLPDINEAVRLTLGAEPQEVRSADSAFRDLTAGRRFNAALMATFGSVALLVGALGVYATMAFAVAQRVRTIGLCLALGASRSRILRSVLLTALRQVLFGVLLGIALSLSVSTSLTSLVFGIRPTDAQTYILVVALLALVGVCAALAPAVRAARLDPIQTLRHE